MKRAVLIAVLALFAPTGWSHAGGPSSGHHHDHGGGFEIGVSLEYAYLEETIEESPGVVHDESDSAFGLHLHVIRSLSGDGFQKYFGVGVGVEALFAEEPHFGLMGSLAVYPWNEVALMISPGVEFAKHEGETESAFSMHYEAAYGFVLGSMHLGPAIGFAHTSESRHYSVGLHLGF